VFRFIDQILADTERSENRYARRMFFRHGRFFVMAIVAHRSAGLIRRAEAILSPEDKTRLSRLTNELAELIYTESQPMTVTKGYLSLFRNLTDAQQLADGVLRRLEALDRQRVSA